MGPEILAFFLLAVVASVALVFGIAIGAAGERRAWLLRALTDKNKWGTPHHCEGTFYYVIPETEFVLNYQRRPDPPE